MWSSLQTGDEPGDTFWFWRVFPTNFLRSRSSFFRSNTNCSSANWYWAVRKTDRRRSSGSPLSFVKPSATIRSVGIHRGSNLVLAMDCRITAISIATRLSSKVPPVPKVMRWSYNDLQSVIPMGDRKLSMWSTLSNEKGPSKASARIKEHHSAIPEVDAKHWASPANVDDTTLGSLYDFQPTTLTGESTPFLNWSLVRPTIQPPWVRWLTAFAKAASDQKQIVSSFGGMNGTVISRSACCLARLTAWLAKSKCSTVGLGNDCCEIDVCTAKSGRDCPDNQPSAPFTTRRAAISRSVACFQCSRDLSLESLIGWILFA